jgi:hypothetical protein
MHGIRCRPAQSVAPTTGPSTASPPSRRLMNPNSGSGSCNSRTCGPKLMERSGSSNKSRQNTSSAASSLRSSQSSPSLLARISNSLEDFQAVKAVKPMDPQVYMETNLNAQHIVNNANTMIFRMNLPWWTVHHGTQRVQALSLQENGIDGKVHRQEACCQSQGR